MGHTALCVQTGQCLSSLRVSLLKANRQKNKLNCLLLLNEDQI